VTGLVDRGAEQRLLRGLVEAAAGGRGGAVLLLGEAGVGKSALAEAAAAFAARAGLATSIGRALHLQVERPLAAALEALGTRPGEVFGLPAGEDRPARTVLEAGAHAVPAFLAVDRLLDRLEAACQERPMLLVLEDLQWSDEATLRWLRLVLGRVAGLPLAVVLTARPPRRGTELHRFLTGLPQDDVVRLGPLPPDDVRALAAQVLHSDPGPLLTGVLDATGGNPLLVLAVVQALSAGGALRQAGRKVELAGDPATVHAGSVLDLRLDEFDADTLFVLQVAAVLGPRPAVADVGTVLARPLHDVLPALESAAAAGVLVADGDGYAFRHELYRDAVLASAGQPALHALHLDAARALAAAGAPAGVVAEHYTLGARPGNAEAVGWLQRAAEELVAVAPGPALRLLDAALALAAPGPDVELMILRVRALAGAGHTAEAEALAHSLLAGRLDPAAEAQLRRELALAYFVQGRAAECVAAMERVVALTTDPARTARLHAEIAFARFVGLDHAGARTAADTAVAEGEASGDVAAQVAGHSVRCWLELFADRFASAAALGERILALVEHPAAGEAHVYQPWFGVALARIEADDLDGAALVVRRGREVAERTGAVWAVPGYEALTAMSALRGGALDDAAAAATATLGYLHDADGFGVAVWCHAFLAQVALHRGDDTAAAEHVTTAERWLVSDRAQLGIEQVMLAKARLLERQGDVAAAHAALASVWELFGLLGVLSARQQIGPDLVRLAVAAGATADLPEVCEELAAGAELTGCASFSADALRAAAWRCADPALALSAVEAARRSPRRPMLAAALSDAALLLRRAGRAGEAERLGQEAFDLWTSMGADADAAAVAAILRRVPRRATRPTTGFGALTATERRVVTLVAEGLPNAAIAGRLFVSRRTVESHVSAAYRKLGVSTRVELARAALDGHRAAPGR
jgi:DNA-binding CsgD family transcriptional regulator/tetratricopeptide (TPR) repeat protein